MVHGTAPTKAANTPGHARLAIHEATTAPSTRPAPPPSPHNTGGAMTRSPGPLIEPSAAAAMVVKSRLATTAIAAPNHIPRSSDRTHLSPAHRERATIGGCLPNPVLPPPPPRRPLRPSPGWTSPPPRNGA